MEKLIMPFCVVLIAAGCVCAQREKNVVPDGALVSWGAGEAAALAGDARVVKDGDKHVLSFSGELGGAATFDVPKVESFTFMTWMKMRDFGKGEKLCPRLFSFPGCFFHVAQHAVQSSREPSYMWRFGVGKKKLNIALSGNFYSNEWAHVAISCEGASNGVAKVYINGKFSDATDAQDFTDAFSAGKMFVGNESNGMRPFSGDMTGIAFYSRVLGADEIAASAKVAPNGQKPKERPLSIVNDRLPVWDISRDEWRQTVIAQGTEEVYQGHPTTVRIPEDNTLYAVWTYNHGGAAGPMAMSKDLGKTWTRVDERLPEVYAKTHRNCPSIYRIVGPDNKARLMIISCKKGIGRMMSEDNGKTWRELEPLPFRCGMPFTGMLRLKDGSTAAFVQTRLDKRVTTDRPKDDQVVCMTVTKDGGFTWSPLRVVAQAKNKNLCEPFALRSDDGNEIALLIRENRHTGNSMMCFSRDEGKTWTQPEETCWGLSGDRHQGVRTKDGRWVIAFRDRAHDSSTYGQFVAWVGTYDDIRNARPGEFRIHLLHHKGAEVHGRKSWRVVDTGYPGMEILDDGTILATTYTQHTADRRKSSVVMTRFKLDER